MQLKSMLARIKSAWRVVRGRDEFGRKLRDPSVEPVVDAMVFGKQRRVAVKGEIRPGVIYVQSPAMPTAGSGDAFVFAAIPISDVLTPDQPKVHAFLKYRHEQAVGSAMQKLGDQLPDAAVYDPMR